MHDAQQVLALEGLDFIEAAYAFALGRPADPSGLRNYLQQLRTGAPKTRVLGELQSSAEGRAHAARCGLGPALPVDGSAGSSGSSRSTPARASFGAPRSPATLAGLLALPDEDFVNQAYWALLQREADAEGSANYLRELHDGSSRIRVLARLRESAEGRALQARLPGLDEAVASEEAAAAQGIGGMVRALSQRLRPSRAAAEAGAPATPPPASSARASERAMNASSDAARPASTTSSITAPKALTPVPATPLKPPESSTPPLRPPARPWPAAQPTVPVAATPASAADGAALLPPLRLERFVGAFAEGYCLAAAEGAGCALGFGGRVLGQLAFDQPRPELQAVHALPGDQLGFRLQLGGLLQFAALAPPAAGFDAFELVQTGTSADAEGMRIDVPLAQQLPQALGFSPLRAFSRMPAERGLGALKGLSFAGGNEMRLLFEAAEPGEDRLPLVLDIYQARPGGVLERLARFAIEPQAQLATLPVRLLSRRQPVLLVATDAQRRLLLTDCIPLPELHTEAQRALLDYHSVLAGGQASFDVAAKIARSHLDAAVSERLAHAQPTQGPQASALPQRASTALLLYSRDSHDFAAADALDAALALCPQAGVLTADGSVRGADGQLCTLQEFAGASGLRHLLLAEQRCALRPDFWAVLRGQAIHCSAQTQLLHWHSVWLDGAARPYVAKTALLLDPALARHALLPLHAALVSVPQLLKVLQAGTTHWRSGALALEHALASLQADAVASLPVVMDTVELPWRPAAEERLLAAHLAPTLAPAVPGSPQHMATQGRPDTPGLSVIINFRNNAEETRQCLEALRAQDWPGALEVILVNNASTLQESLVTSRRAQELFGAAAVRVIDYPQRFNHSAQCNLAVEAAQQPLLLMLSNDALLMTPDALRRAAEVLAMPSVATVGFRIVGGPQAKRKLQSLGLAPSPRQWLLQGGSPLSTYKPPAAMLDKTQQTLGNTFAAAMLRRALYIELGGLDAEAFPTNYNDVDFCCRALQQGYRHVSVGAAVVEHVGRGSREMDLDLPIDQRILDRCPPLARLASIGIVAL